MSKSKVVLSSIAALINAFMTEVAQQSYTLQQSYSKGELFL